MLSRVFREDIHKHQEHAASGTPEHHPVISHHQGKAVSPDIMYLGVHGWYAG
jgi:hypothetical protein